MLKKCAMIAALSLVLLPGTARADWLFTPNIGGGFGGDAEGREHLTWGASIGWMGAGIIGWEADFAYTPEFFEADDDDLDLIENSNVTSFMGNVLVGIPVGGQTGGGFRPYFSGGVGVLQRSVESGDALFEVDNSEFGFNLGAGAMGFMTDHVGFRGDIRYYRSFEDPQEDNEFDLAVGNFDFWRATGGITFRW
ncbi:MAG TPA: outer membrane beta-barrel protein [Vicinamibacterales bacterium]